MKKNVAVFAAVLGLSLSTVSGAFAQELDTENPIKIGYVGALSGDTALWGQAGLNGMELTAKQINEERAAAAEAAVFEYAETEEKEAEETAEA